MPHDRPKSGHDHLCTIFFGGGAEAPKFGRAKKSKIRPNFGQLSILTTIILGTDRDIKKSETNLIEDNFYMV